MTFQISLGQINPTLDQLKKTNPILYKCNKTNPTLEKSNKTNPTGSGVILPEFELEPKFGPP